MKKKKSFRGVFGQCYALNGCWIVETTLNVCKTSNNGTMSAFMQMYHRRILFLKRAQKSGLFVSPGHMLNVEWGTINRIACMLNVECRVCSCGLFFLHSIVVFKAHLNNCVGLKAPADTDQKACLFEITFCACACCTHFQDWQKWVRWQTFAKRIACVHIHLRSLLATRQRCIYVLLSA